ncbi:MAG: phosphotransferase [Planctomycetota bacterium]
MDTPAPTIDCIIQSGADLTEAFISHHIRPHVPIPPGVPWTRTDGYDNFALDFGPHIVRIPGSADSLRCLRVESRVCERLRVDGLDTSRPTLVEGLYPFSWHIKIPGVPFLPERHEAMSEHQRADAGKKLARLFAALHAIPVDEARTLGVVDLPPRREYAELLGAAEPSVPADLHAWLVGLAPEFDDETHTSTPIVGCFDAHPWNLAFDDGTGVLAGAFDFADVAIGQRVLDFMPVCTISPDLARRAAMSYEDVTGVHIDTRRAELELVRSELTDLCTTDTPRTDISVWGLRHRIARLRRWQAMVGG